MSYRQDISSCLAGRIGKKGLAPSELDVALVEAEGALARLREWYDRKTLPLLRLPERRDDLEACRPAVDRLLEGASDIAILGTGGSSLGGQALAQLAGYRVPGIGGSGTVRFHFFDNLDGLAFEQALERLDLRSTRFVVISKSGGTPETIVQLISALEVLKRQGLEAGAADRIVCISEPGSPEKNAIRGLARRHRLEVLDHDPNIGGRYSVLSNVGLFPAMLMGLDAEAFRSGARPVVENAVQGLPAADVPPAVGAAVHHALKRKGELNVVVTMPYSDRLRLFSAWHQQLWAESLGKEGRGTQPVAAAGPVDQHSQMQLFLDGPADKLLTFIKLETAGSGPCIPDSYRDDPLLGYLAGRTVGDLIDCQQRATAETLARAGRPVRSFQIGKLDEAALGALFMHFMLETIIAGLMMRIDPFDQPAVERSKVLTREYLAAM